MSETVQDAPGAAASAGLGAMIVGVAGFCAGFFGPILVNPGANQGPLVGIFITGPGGAVLGAGLGAVLGMAGVTRAFQLKVLGAVAAVGTVATLFFALPGPEFRGNILDLTVTGCASPLTMKAEAFEYWEKRIAAANWARTRPGWKEGFEAMAAADPGVVLSVSVYREAGLYENQKPWNRGTFAPGKAWWVQERYFAPGGTCADWPAGRGGVFRAVGDPRTSKEWPAEVLPNFLNLQVLSPAPDELAAMLPRR